MPNPENTHLTILTVDTTVQCYSLVTEESNPRVYACVEDKESFIPIPTNKLMMNLITDRGKINKLLETLPEIHNENSSKSLAPDMAFSCSILSAHQILEASGG